jgi:hypothetical protein
MKSLLIIILGLFFVSAKCERQVDEQRTGIAVVTEKVYIPSQHGSGIAIGSGFSFSGQSSNFGQMSTVSVNIPEGFNIVFNSEWDGVFVIEDRDLYGKLNIGDTVKFIYTVIVNQIVEDKVVISSEFHRVRRIGRFIDGKEYYAQ